MHNKTIAAGALLLLALITPAAMGHSERAPLAVVDLGSGYTGAASNGVSGRYVGAAGTLVAIEANTNPQSRGRVCVEYLDSEDPSSSPLHYPALAPWRQVAQSPGHDNNPPPPSSTPPPPPEEPREDLDFCAQFSRTQMFCDAEVVVDDPTFAGNEQDVDGITVTGGVDNFWDDGGLGGACHTANYSTPGFNTPGCQSGQQAFASDASTLDIWIAAACDWKTVQGGAPGVLTFLACNVSGSMALTPAPAVVVAETLALTQCVVDFVACLLNPACGATGTTETCGADTFLDAIHFGYGSGNIVPVTFPANAGVITNGNPPVTNACPASDGTASVFVYNTVMTNGGSYVDADGTGESPDVYLPGTVEVHPATFGHIWS